MLLPFQLNGLNLDSGTAVAVVSGSFTEAQIVAGGQEITITLTNDTWVASGATFNAQRQNIIDGLDSAQSELLGWNNEVRDKEVVTAVVRTSDTVVTITLTASPLYDITSDETITVTVPATALTGAVELTGTPTLGVTADAEVETEEIRSGGWAALNAYEAYQQRKKRRRREREEILKSIPDEVDREIAAFMHPDPREQEIAELDRLVADTFRNDELKLAKEYSERVAKAYVRAAMQHNFSALEAFEREMDRAREEDEFLLIALSLLG